MDQYKNKVRVAAHRGNAKYYPENTMVAYQSALDLGVDQLEVDLHMTRDGEIIMMHDDLVDRTTNGTGMVRTFTRKEIQELDAGCWKGTRFSGTRVPTFIELLERLTDYPTMTVNVELKDYPDIHGEAWAQKSCDKALALLDQFNMNERIWINCFSAPLLEYIDAKYEHSYRLHGYFPLERMRGNMIRDPYEYLHCACLFGPEDAPVREKVDFDYLISRGVEPWVYYKDDSEVSYQKAIERGAMLITSNDPEKCLCYLRNHGLHD